MTVADQVARFVTFRVGRELYAIDVSHVEQVLRYEAVRHMPRLPAWIDGVLEYQGKVVPLIDLRKHFDVDADADAGDPQRTRLLLMNIDGEWCAVAVDQVLDVRPYDLSAETEAPRTLINQTGELYAGMVRRGTDLVAVIDATHLFSAAERAVLRRATQRRSSRAASRP